MNLTIPSTGWRFELSCVICMYKVFGWLYHDSPEYNVRKMWSSFFHLFRVGREWTSSKKMFSTGSFFSLPSHLVEGSWLLDLNGCKCLSFKGPDWTILNFVSVSNDCFLSNFIWVAHAPAQNFVGAYVHMAWMNWTENQYLIQALQQPYEPQVLSVLNRCSNSYNLSVCSCLHNELLPQEWRNWLHTFQNQIRFYNIQCILKTICMPLNMPPYYTYAYYICPHIIQCIIKTVCMPFNMPTY